MCDASRDHVKQKPRTMKRMAQILSAAALAATIIPPGLFFADHLGLEATKRWLLGATILWFAATPFWMEHKATE